MRTQSRLPRKWNSKASAPFGPETPTNTVPTGFSGVPPSGPATPVADTPQVEPLTLRAPSAISRAHWALTAP